MGIGRHDKLILTAGVSLCCYTSSAIYPMRKALNSAMDRETSNDVSEPNGFPTLFAFAPMLTSSSMC